MKLALLLSLCADPLLAFEPAFQIGLDEMVFQTTEDQVVVDLEQLVAERSIIDIAFDGLENLGQRQFKWNNDSGHRDRV